MLLSQRQRCHPPVRNALRLFRWGSPAFLCSFALLFLLAACSNQDGPPVAVNIPGTTADSYGSPIQASQAQGALPGQQPPTAILHVPEEYKTIQAAVDATRGKPPGSLIMVAPGTYREAVLVQSSDITIRGRDRASVILDGGYQLPNAFQVIKQKNVVIENMTAKHFIGNGFFWTGVDGYRGSYLTAYNNGDYGVYAYASINGQFDHSYASGNPDSGFYIGGCQPCNAVITDVISENNGLGYSGTNAGGNLVIRNSIWRNNMAGIVPNTLDTEPAAPQAGVTITNNLVENNHNYNAPSKSSEYPAIGNGIVLAGGNNNVVKNNRVNGHQYYGILVIPNIDENFWQPSGNTVSENIVTNSGVADLALAALSGGNNCFSDNTIARTIPPILQTTHGCNSPTKRIGAGDMSSILLLLNHFIQIKQKRFIPQDWAKLPDPSNLTYPGMADTDSILQGIFTTQGGTLDMTLSPTVYVPTLSIAGVGLTSPFFEVLLSLYAYYLPLAIFVVWLAIAVWDLIRRELGQGARLGWFALVFLVPIVGPFVYYLFGRSQIPWSTRLALIIGAPLIYIGISALLLFLIS